MNIRAFILLFIGIVIACTGAPKIGFAQQKDTNKGELLPDINPQDIEIRGKFQARFPGLNRQPILGFNPEMQIFQIDPNRKPFMESGDEVVSNLPISNLAQPEPPLYEGLGYADEISTYIKAGIGSYTSPSAKYWGAYKLNNNSYVGGKFNLSSSDDYLDRSSSFRFLTGQAEFGTNINKKMRFKLHAGLQNDFNYSARFNEAGPNTVPLARIKYQGYNAGAELDHFTNDIAGWKLQGNIRNFNTDFNAAQNGGSINEMVYNGSFSNRWALGRPNETIALKIGGRGGSYDADNRSTQHWGTLQGGVAYEGLFNYNTKLHAEANLFYTSDVKNDNIYPGGRLQIDHWFGNRLKITGRVKGSPNVHSVEQLHQENRFLGYDNQLIHTYTVDVTGKAEIKYYRGSKLHGGVTYQNFTNYAYFTPYLNVRYDNIPAAQQPADLYTINYQNATNVKIFGGITHQLMPERFWVSASAYVQHPELDNGGKIPFEEKWGANGSISFRPIDLLTFKGWGSYVSKRHTTINSDEKLDGFFLLGGQVDIDFADNFGVYAKLVNITSAHYQRWKGYRERPFQVYGGITLKF